MEKAKLAKTTNKNLRVFSKIMFLLRPQVNQRSYSILARFTKVILCFDPKGDLERSVISGKGLIKYKNGDSYDGNFWPINF